MKNRFFTLRTKQRGFSLVEMSLVILIMSMTAGTLLSFAAFRTEDQKAKETRAKMEVITQALELFVLEQGRLPCPARIATAINGTNFGREVRAAAPSYACGARPVGFTSGTLPHLDYGAVPVKTLQLSDDHAFDGWGRRFSFAVMDTCARSKTESPTANYTTTDCGGTSSLSGSSVATHFLVRSASGSWIADASQQVVMVLLSHGSNGHGARNRSGVRRLSINTTVSTDELENSHFTAARTSTPYDNIFVSRALSAEPDYFDDIVLHKTKRQLSLAGGGLSVNDGLCQFSGTTIPSTTDAARLAKAEEICGSPVDTRCATILKSLADTINARCF